MVSRASTPRIGACILACFWASAGAAHDLAISAEAEGATITVTVTYEDGTIPYRATVTVSTEAEPDLMVLETDGRGQVGFPRSTATEGVIIEASDDDGHFTYSILTPADIE